MKAGTNVRHRGQPEWVVDAAQGKCRIQFEHAGVVMLSRETGGNNLEVLSPRRGCRPWDGHRAAGTSRRPNRRVPMRRLSATPEQESLQCWQSVIRPALLHGVEHVF